MLDTKVAAIQKDVKTLIDDANGLLHEASVSTGAAANELRDQGINSLKTALSKIQGAQVSAIAASKELGRNADIFVHQNPWKVVSISGGLGLLLGFLLARK
jgi:ElaB/YqjD/DUF883 family membrane-anchored ribosome-binding protein